MNSSHYSLPPTAVSDRKAKTPDHPVSFFVRAPQEMIANNFIIYVRLPYFRLLLIILIYDVFYVRIFVEIFVLSNRKIYNFRVDLQSAWYVFGRECRLYIIKFKAPNNFIGRYLKPYL